MSTPALAVNNLTVKLDQHTVLNNISFTVAPEQTTAIIGPNGAGKSILLKAILKLIPKEHGSVKIFGIDHEQFSRLAPLISYIPQSFVMNQNFPLTVRGLFALSTPGPIGLSAAAHERMMDLLQMVGMNNIASARLSTLSGGQLQRVLIAYSLLKKPRLLLLDEPSAGIDIRGQETIYTLLERIQRQEHVTLVLVSHELDIVARHAAQVLCLNRNLICAGTPEKALTTEVLEQMYGASASHFTHHHE